MISKQLSMRFVSAACVLLSMVLFVGEAQALSAVQKYRIRQLIDHKMRIDGVPGASFAVVENGVVSWSDGIGLANVELNVAATEDSVYRSASLVKPLTATAVLQLAELGKLDLDADVSTYCPAFPKKQWVITSRALLSHTAGIRSYNMPWSVFEKELYSTKHYPSVADSLSQFSEDPLLFEPGSARKYSSFGYTLLGCVIEGASGMKYMAYLTKHVLEPANMQHTIAADDRQPVKGRAGLYVRAKKGQLLNDRFVDLSNKVPAGGLLTTAKDMASFAASYMNEQLLKADSIAMASQAVTLLNAEQEAYGMGWELEKAEQGVQSVLLHGGITPGVSGEIYLSLSTKNAVVFFMNLYGIEGREVLARDILSVIDSESP